MLAECGSRDVSNKRRHFKHHRTSTNTISNTTMGSSDLDQLIEMGFDQERAQLAISKTGGSMCFIRAVDAVTKV